LWELTSPSGHIAIQEGASSSDFALPHALSLAVNARWSAILNPAIRSKVKAPSGMGQVNQDGFSWYELLLPTNSMPIRPIANVWSKASVLMEGATFGQRDPIN